MERDIIIMNKILQAAYELRSHLWLTAHMVRNNIGETLSIQEIKYYLGVLCDRDMLKSNNETYATFSQKNLLVKRGAERITHKTNLYRITERGAKYVQAGFQKELKFIGFARTTAKG